MNKDVELIRRRVTRILSGGQTGADRAALDFALENGIAIGGFVPHGRLAEDGAIPTKYRNMVETASGDPKERTRLNVESGDGTLIVSHGPLSGGSRYTHRCAVVLQKPLLQVDLRKTSEAEAASNIREWLIEEEVGVLNVAGPRASKDPQIYSSVIELLRIVWDKKKGRP